MERINERYYMFSEPMDDDLFNLINKGKAVDNNIKKYIICQLIYGIKCLHDMGVVHGDIKPDNIFFKIDKNGLPLIKFGDFDGSGINEIGIKTQANTNTFLRYSTHIDNADFMDDIFALGLTICWLIEPYSTNDILNFNDDNRHKGKEAINPKAYYTKILNDNFKISNRLRKLILRMITDIKPITATQIINSKFFRDLCNDVNDYFFSEKFIKTTKVVSIIDDDDDNDEDYDEDYNEDEYDENEYEDRWLGRVFG
jgi:serine/threonine-protein kinase